MDPDDIEMLEDLIVAATNEALRKVEEESGAAMSKLTGGLGWAAAPGDDSREWIITAIRSAG